LCFPEDEVCISGDRSEYLPKFNSFSVIQKYEKYKINTVTFTASNTASWKACAYHISISE